MVPWRWVSEEAKAMARRFSRDGGYTIFSRSRKHGKFQTIAQNIAVVDFYQKREDCVPSLVRKVIRQLSEKGGGVMSPEDELVLKNVAAIAYAGTDCTIAISCNILMVPRVGGADTVRCKIIYGAF